MKAGNAIRTLSLLAALGVAAACEQTPLALDDQPDLASLVVPTGTNYKVIVCKDGPPGFNYSFTVSATGDQSALTLAGGGSFTLQDEGCVDAAVTTAGGHFATVTELTPPAGTLFSQVDVYLWDTGNNSQSHIYTSTTNPVVNMATIGGGWPFGNDWGQVIVYTNIPAPSTGCTLTQGYWKTHSEFGPAPYDATWALLTGGLGASTTFFLSGQTWYEVFGTPPAGNAYYNLAHQYMAAVLNGLAGASTSAVTTALASATTLFNTYTPAQIAALAKNSSLRAEFISLAGTLGAYNEGLTGPGHCGGSGS